MLVFNCKKLAVIIVLSALGGISSLVIGYAARMLSFIPLSYPVVGQLLAGLHVLWLALVAVTIKVPGSASMAGAVKGLVELFLLNPLGPFVFFISLLQGVTMDAVLLPFGYNKRNAVLLACGLASMSNVFVLQFFQILPSSVPISVYGGMYVASFCSGLVFGGYLAVKTVGGR